LVVPKPGELQLVTHPRLDLGAAQIRREPPCVIGVLTGIAQKQP